MSYDLLCIGNALVDIFAEADEETANRHGIEELVQHIEIEKIHCFLDELKIAPKADDITVVSGGGAANVAKIAGLLGAKTLFTGAIGKDDNTGNFGHIFKKDLESAGVKLRLSLKPSPTGLCLYLKIADETRIAASPSAALELSENDIFEDDFKKVKAVVIDGYMLGRKTIIKYILYLTKQYGIPAAIDIGSAFIAKKHGADILEYARGYSLILFMNEEEALCGEWGLTTLEWSESCRLRGLDRICSFFCSFTKGKDFPVIVVKLGAAGAVCFAGGEMYRAEAEAVVKAETTGAGDAFCAGFLTAFVQGKHSAECTALGNNTARLVLNTAGTQAAALTGLHVQHNA